MALGKRGADQQQEFWVSAVELPKAPGHPFYMKLNELLAEADFDRWVESLCEEFYANGKGRPSIPPGVYFRMLLVGYFEGLGSQRGIAKMKDSRTHLAYKAENTVDLDTDMVLSADVYHADRGDNDTVTSSVVHARKNLLESGSEVSIEELVADKGYHKAQTLSDAQRLGLRTYIPEPASRHRRRWTDKPAGHKQAVYANRRRVRGDRSKRLQRKRSEYLERTFAHMCETGDGRRTWLRGLEKVTKRYLIQAAARNLGVILRKLFGMGTPRGLQKGLSPVFGQLLAALSAMSGIHWRREINPAFRRLDDDDLAFATAAA